MNSNTETPSLADSLSASSSVWDLHQVSTIRSLSFLGISALIGLGLAGYGLFTAKGTTVRVVPPEDVALVNQRPILRSDFVLQAESLLGLPFAQTNREQRGKVLDDMIREELFVQRGVELDFAGSDPDVRQALVTAVERQVQADVTAQKPTDAQLMEVYTRNQDQYSSEGRMTVRLLQLPSNLKAKLSSEQALAQARQVVDAVRGGAKIDDVVTKFNWLDTKKTNGEEFYFSSKIHLGEALFNTARTLKDGSISDPLVQPDGVYLLAMQSNVLPVPLAFEAARERVLRDYIKAAQEKLLRSNEKYVREQADILIAPELR